MANFRNPKAKDEEEAWLRETIPSNTRNTTKWSVKIFNQWQHSRANKCAKNEGFGFKCNIDDVQDLNVDLTEMTPSTLNFWLTKFIGEVANKSGGRYPPKSLYVIVSGINRHLQNVNAENSVNFLNKNDRRFCTFRKALDAEMREATKLGVTQATQKEPRENITEEEEALFWKLKLLGNSIIFDETLSKTFHGGLKDLKKGKRIVNHQCHGEGKQHSPCLLAMYSMYLELVKDIAPKVECFYCRPKRDGSMGYEKSAVGISTLNKILPEKLCDKARIPRKTSHCLRITCATSLFQNGVEEKLIRERTGHTSNALLRYQLPSLKQIETASAVLGPSIATEQKGEESVAKREWEVDKCTKTVPSSNSLQLNDFGYDVPDELLADVCLPESASLGSSDNFQFDLSDEMLASIPNTNAIFNNCNVSFNFNFK
ncbi:hypothetical protein AC249_AIPGENE11740 [Exaiptasia diaphana]|nr:hypothetical protein AC249_AIPGENE11740 [Exaiptasia diaphana]